MPSTEVPPVHHAPQSALRALLTTFIDRNGDISHRQITETWDVVAERMRRGLAMSHAHMSAEQVENLVTEVFAELDLQLRASGLARIRHSPRRAARWLFHRLCQHLAHARGRETTDAHASILEGASGEIVALARDLARLPPMQRYCLSWRATGLSLVDCAYIMGIRVGAYARHCAQGMETLGDPVCEIDRDGRVRDLNDAAVRLLGVADGASVRHRPVHELLHGGAPTDERVCPIHETLALGEAHHTHDRFRTAGGTQEVEYLCTPTWARGNEPSRDDRERDAACAPPGDARAGVTGAIIRFRPQSARGAAAAPERRAVRSHDRSTTHVTCGVE